MSGDRCEFMQYHVRHNYRNDRGEPRQCDGLYPPPDAPRGYITDDDIAEAAGFMRPPD